MTVAARQPRKLTIEQFLAFYDTRPDEEQWQLIDGVALLMTPPFVVHQVIASNLQRLLNEAAERANADWRAYQRIGVELPEFPHYRPEPDVAVIDREVPPGRRHVDRFYLVAEILSSSDDERIGLKRDFYRAHEHNRAVLLLSQERPALELDRRINEEWTTEILSGAGALLALPDFGFACRLGDLYANTPVARRPTSR
jgi:Uma2 family endonuclease